ncbi:MAG TPA: hypothetical protein VM677_15220 [Actinokineospora sp.]|jgi:hypothetical protein|nr:hypothetical protein [Actinokineospora sp.]
MPDRSAAPVFVDPTGKRRKTVRTATVVTVGALTTVGGLLLAALLGAPIGPTASLPVPPPPSVAVPVEQPDQGQPGQPGQPGTSESGEPTTTITTTAAKPTQGAPVTTTTTTTDAVTTTTSKPGNPTPGKPSDRPTKPPR